MNVVSIVKLALFLNSELVESVVYISMAFCDNLLEKKFIRHDALNEMQEFQILVTAPKRQDLVQTLVI